MRSLTSQSLALLIATAASSGIVRAETVAAPNLAPAGAPKAEFVFRPGFTKDPFFPRSTDGAVVPPPTQTTISTSPTANLDFLALKGISIDRNGRKLAILNGYTVGPGEEVSVKREGKPVNIRCVEIKERSVVVSSEGVSKEIPLRIN